MCVCVCGPNKIKCTEVFFYDKNDQILWLLKSFCITVEFKVKKHNKDNKEGKKVCVNGFYEEMSS